MTAAPTRGHPGGIRNGSLPLVIGVTGHRNLDPADYPIYRQRIAGLLAHLRHRYPSTPLRVISALAEGADRLAAQVALESGCELLVPLPMEPDDYELDFPHSVQEFRSLLANIPAELVFVVPPPVSERDSHSLSERREIQYREAGAYTAGQCHVLVALWDGLPSESDAGTAAVVRMKLEGHSSSGIKVLDLEDGGPVFHVHAPRSGSGSSADQPARWIFPRDADEALFATICRRIERFNVDAARLPSQRLGAAPESLLPHLEDRPASDRKLAAVFFHADRLARRYQRLTHSALRLLLGLAGALALTFELYAEIAQIRILPGIYLLIFGAILLLYGGQKRLDAHGRYLDYRALAEGLRVQLYWRLAGLSDSASANYLRNQLDELRWIREALRAANAIPPPAQPQPDVAFRHWVRDQTRFYKSRAELHERRARRLEHLSVASLVVGLLATLGLVVFWNSLERLGPWHHWLVLVMGFAPIVAALWETYGERFGQRSQAHQYARFAAIFGRAEKAVAGLASEPASPQRSERELALIRELGRESLIESGGWVLLLRDRPIVLPKG